MKFFKLQNHITWVKSITIKGEAFDRVNNPKPNKDAIHSYGHFKPVNSKRFLNNTFENIFHFTKTGENDIQRLAIGVPFNDCQNLYRRKHRNTVRCRGNTWYIPYHTVISKTEKYNHPAGFPYELPLTCIKLHGIKDNLVVLCEAGRFGLVCHRLLGHRGSYLKINEHCLEDVKIWKERLK